MKILDANLLLYALNRDTPLHTKAKAWLERSLAGDEPVAFEKLVELARAQAEEHVAELRHGRIGEDALYVLLHEGARAGR